MKYQVKWKSGYYKHEGCSRPSFCFDTLSKEELRNDGTDKTNLFFKAELEGESWQDIFNNIHKYFSDCQIISKKELKSYKTFNVLKNMLNIILLLFWIVISILSGIVFGIGIGIIGGCKKTWYIFLTGLEVLIIKNMMKDRKLGIKLEKYKAYVDKVVISEKREGKQEIETIGDINKSEGIKT